MKKTHIQRSNPQCRFKGLLLIMMLTALMIVTALMTVSASINTELTKKTTDAKGVSILSPQEPGFSTVNSEQPKKKLSGSVSDEKGEPLPGVTVMVKGTTIGTITDFDGKFLIDVPADAKTIVFTFVGYKSQEEPVKLTLYKISMKEQTIGLEEVVVVGYGIQKKVNITGAVTTVRGAELIKSPVPNLTAALVGRTSGLMAIQNSGQPGVDDVTLRIRGIGTLSSAAASPLVLVDGIERNFNQIDPNEVESINVLKDASSTAVYGIRGANGVIIVTTKKGVEGKTVVNYSGNFSLQTPTRLPSFVNGPTFARLYTEASQNDNSSAVGFTDEEIQTIEDGSDPLFYPNTDWLKLVLKKYAPQTQHNLNISGGTKKVKYYVSLGYLNQDGLVKNFEAQSGISSNSTYDRYNFRSNFDIDVTPTTQVNVQLGGNSSLRNSSKGTEADFPYENIFRTLLVSAPTATVGLWEGKQIVLDRSGSRNALSNLMNGAIDKLDNNFNFNFGIVQKLDMITKGLSIRSKIAYDSYYGRRRVFTRNSVTYTPVRLAAVAPETVGEIVLRPSGDLVDVVGNATVSFSRSVQSYLDFGLDYGRSFGKNNVSALLLYKQNKRWFHNQSYPGIPLGYQDWVGRVTYNYDSKYMLEFNMGRNGSENFPVNNRFGWFPALSAGWILTGEPFVKNLIGGKVLSYMKLRASYGTVGNDKLGNSRFMYYPSEYLPGNSTSGYGVLGQDPPTKYGSYVEGKLGNPDVVWEKAKKLDIAADMKFFNDHYSLNVDYFAEDRSNIITALATVPGYVAAVLQDAYNIGIVKNKGFEIETGWNSKVKGFSYWMNGNFSFARNKIEYMNEALNTTYPNLNRTGHRVGEQFGYIFDGFFNTPEEVAAAPLYFGKQPTLGDTKYKDITNDGVINSNDQQAIGNPRFPEMSFGFSFGFSYKGFEASALFSGSGNTSVFVADYLWKPFNAFGSAADITEGRWSATDPNRANATFPKLTVDYGTAQNYYNSTLNLRSGSYLRLKNVEVGYNFSLKRIHVSNVRVFVSGQNLLTWDKLKVVDPEGDPGYNWTYPQLQVYNVGCKFQF